MIPNVKIWAFHTEFVDHANRQKNEEIVTYVYLDIRFNWITTEIIVLKIDGFLTTQKNWDHHNAKEDRCKFSVPFLFKQTNTAEWTCLNTFMTYLSLSLFFLQII